MQSKYVNIGLLGLILVVALAWWFYRQPRFQTGEMAPAFTAKLHNGQTASITDFRGKYVLIQFWGSWCGPCRAENPYLVDLYRKYHKQGFEIFSIGVERNAASWQNAIKADEMTWPYHTADMQEFGGELTKLFNIHSIPTTFLVDPEGKIIRTNPSPDDIDQILAENLLNS